MKRNLALPFGKCNRPPFIIAFASRLSRALDFPNPRSKRAHGNDIISRQGLYYCPMGNGNKWSLSLILGFPRSKWSINVDVVSSLVLVMPMLCTRFAVGALPEQKKKDHPKAHDHLLGMRNGWNKMVLLVLILSFLSKVHFQTFTILSCDLINVKKLKGREKSDIINKYKRR